MIIKSLTIRNNRNFINGMPLARFVWNHYHPDDPWTPGFIIHHEDEATLNDWHENLDKVTRGGHNVIHSTGRPVSERTRKRLSECNKGRIISEWQKKQISLANTGKVLSVETKNKISNSLKRKISGVNNPFYGKHHSEETKRKISTANFGKKRSDEYKKNKSEFMKDKHHSEETKNKMRTKVFSNEYKLKISESCKKAWAKRKGLI